MLEYTGASEEIKKNKKGTCHKVSRVTPFTIKSIKNLCDRKFLQIYNRIKVLKLKQHRLISI